MSFVSRLRMANMFPIKSDLGNARINAPDDNYDALINEALSRRQPMQQRPNGINMVGQKVNPAQREPLRFGGVMGEQSNPGADILNRARGNAERIYESYKQPLNAPVEGPSRDEIHLENYFNRKNKETVANATAANAGNKGWKTVNVTDPNDPTKNTAIQVNDQTGETRPIDVGGVITNKTSPQALEKINKDRAKAITAREAIKSKAQSSLDLLGDLLDKDDNLTSEAQWATGATSIFGKIPLPTPAYEGASKINQLSKQRVLDLIGELKAQSATGATGFGNMSNKDLGTLQEAATLLERPGLPEKTIRQELIKIKGILNRIIQDGPNETINNEMKPAVSHNTSGRIKVRDKATGKTGTISEGAFNPQKYDRVQ